MPPALRLPIAALAACAALLPFSAAAGEQTGHITSLITRSSDNLIYFYLSGTASGRPACATYRYWMIKDEASDTGKRQFAMLMAAYLSGRQVAVTGAGTCTRWGDGEDVNDVQLWQP